MEYKNTLLMPKTAFEMKANLPKKEPLIQQKWIKQNIYDTVLTKNKNLKKYNYLDGPPYANGSIHIGHALNKIIKDINIRYRNMNGYCAQFQLGWDTHGLPIENMIEKSGIKIKEKTRLEVCSLCENYAKEQIELQKEQFKKLGLFTKYDDYYATFQKEYEVNQVKSFFELLKKGYIFRDLKPVYWSWSSESALAEAEVEYKMKKSHSIYVKFFLKNNNLCGINTSLIIWTTTPWTIPGNKAIAVNPKFNYALLKINGEEQFIILESLIKELTELFKWKDVHILKIVKGSELENLQYIHPLNNEVYPVILANHVSDHGGTGLVHTAPGHGIDDYNVAIKYNLKIISIVDAKGMIKDTDKYDGMFYQKASKFVIQDLLNQKALIFHTEIEHSYPHDWRTQKPIIFRATKQWFITIKDLKTNLLQDLNQIVTYPNWGKKRMQLMIQDRGDWCISRQRTWGVPIPIIYDQNKNPIIYPEIIDHQIKLFEKHGISSWAKLPIKQLLPDGYAKFADDYTKETDIMDVWFDSGTAFHTLIQRGDEFVADAYIEGNDQFRGWFNSSLIIAKATLNKVPYKQLITHGFVLDKNGNKMSKSKGNVIDPLKLINQYGADVLRLWVSSVNYQEDVRISDAVMKQVSESYRKIRNTIRFMIGNLNNYSLKNIALTEVDQYLIHLTNKLIEDVKSAYETFHYERIYHLVTNFVINNLSGFYLDIAKDVVYVEKENSTRRQQILFVFYNITQSLLTLLTPIIPHTCEEAYSIFPNSKKEISILLTEMKMIDIPLNINLHEWDKIWKIKNDIYQEIEKARQNKIIGKSLEAHITINLKESYSFFNAINLSEIFMVSTLTKVNSPDLIKDAIEKPTCWIFVTKHPGTQCKRCWKYFNASEMHDDNICHKCYKVIK